MKTIGLLGGMSWESTVSYYKLINEGVKRRMGGLHSAKIVLYSVNFQELEALLQTGEWEKIGGILSGAARKVEKGGADFLLICTNTMHQVADSVSAAADIPLLHIVDATAERIQQKGYRRVGLLGTRFTMEQAFYKGRLSDRFGIDTVIPPKTDRELVHQVIFDELCLGKIRDESRTEYRRIIRGLQNEGAEAVILGCTEIAMLVDSSHTSVPLLDTTQLHAEKAVEKALD